MTCKHCGDTIEKRGDHYVVVRFRMHGWEEFDSECDRTIEDAHGDWYMTVGPHEPSKNSIVIDILKDL